MICKQYLSENSGWNFHEAGIKVCYKLVAGTEDGTESGAEIMKQQGMLLLGKSIL